MPFPAPEVVTVLPNHERLLPLLLQYDLVGLQTETDVGNFARYLIAEQRVANRRVFEATDGQLVFSAGGRHTRIGSFPVGINPEEFQRLAQRAVKSSFVRDVVQSLGNRALVIGVDRLDYSKGLIQRMEAFERFYALHPGMAKQGHLSANRAEEPISRFPNIPSWNKRSARRQVASTASMAKWHGRPFAISTAPIAAPAWQASIVRHTLVSSRRSATA